MYFSKYTDQSEKDIAKEFSVSPGLGLTSTQASQLLSKFGTNEIAGRQVTWAHILLRQFKSAFLYLLVAAGAISIVLGETLDGIMILAFVLINASLGFYQEFRSHQALKLLEKYIASKSRVIRDGEILLVESRYLVPGDVLLLTPGDIIRADVRIIQADSLFCDESVLTGESIPVEKTEKPASKPEKEIFKAENIGFSGTTVISGKAKGIVVATGVSTAIGEIAKLTAQTPSVSSFEKNITKLSRFVLNLIVVTLILVFVTNILIKGANVNLLELVIFTIALAVSVIPEALPVVTTFSLSKGAVNLAKNKVVVKRLSAIEDLGGIQVLCTDKTGTLTENQLKLADVVAKDKNEAILLASLVSSGGENHNKIDPFDLAIWEALEKPSIKLLKSYQRLQEMPFDPKRRRNSQVIKKEGKTYLLSRGAPEEIIKICRKGKDLKHASSWAEKKGREGFRVLALAAKEISHKGKIDFAKEESQMDLAGVFSFSDPLKPTAASAIGRAKVLGIKVKILTGDAKEVAGMVAKEIKLTHDARDVITGEEFDSLNDFQKRQAVENYSVFARVSPEQKFEIIKYLQEVYEVGFLGEGINDAPALKIANVAIVVQGAADIAKDSADIILLKKSLDVVIDGIGEGRRVFANTAKYIRSTLTSNFGNFFAVATASLLINYLPLLPLQILLLNLLSDFPMISIATDNVEEEELAYPKSYAIRDIALIAVVLGLISTLFDFIFFGIFYRISPQVLQTNWFIASVLTELALVFSIRTAKPFFRAKRASGTIIVLTVVTILVTIIIPFTQLGDEIFGFTKPTVFYIALISAVVALYFATSETVKLLYYRFVKQSN